MSVLSVVLHKRVSLQRFTQGTPLVVNIFQSPPPCWQLRDKLGRESQPPKAVRVRADVVRAVSVFEVSHIKADCFLGSGNPWLEGGGGGRWAPGLPGFQGWLSTTSSVLWERHLNSAGFFLTFGEEALISMASPRHAPGRVPCVPWASAGLAGRGC